MNAKVEVTLVDGPLPPAAPAGDPGAGAVWLFEGIVRPREQNRPLAALDYEAYEPMTSRELHRLAQRLAEEFRLIRIAVEHSIGRVPTGDRSFRLTVTSPHRAEGAAAANRFIEEMKQQVPLWKNPVYAPTPPGVPKE